MRLAFRDLAEKRRLNVFLQLAEFGFEKGWDSWDGERHVRIYTWEEIADANFTHPISLPCYWLVLSSSYMQPTWVADD